MRRVSRQQSKLSSDIESSRQKYQKRRSKMEWQIILALVLAIPVILFPAALIWYLNIGGIFQSVREARKTREVVKVAG